MKLYLKYLFFCSLYQKLGAGHSCRQLSKHGSKPHNVREMGAFFHYLNRKVDQNMQHHKSCRVRPDQKYRHMRQYVFFQEKVVLAL